MAAVSDSPAPLLRATVASAALGALAALLMAIAHLGVDLPLLPTVGAGRPVPPAAAAFGLGTLACVVVAVGLARRARWSWPLGLLVFALGFTGAAFPYRGVGSAVGMALCAAVVALLLTPSVRATLFEH